MSAVVSSSVIVYQSLVRRQAEKAAQSWIEQLANGLSRNPSTLEDQLKHWETLTRMAVLNWRNDDQRVATAQEEGHRSYQRELSGGQESPPSARYLLSHPNGEFIFWYVVDNEPEPLELIQRHVEVIEKKEAVLRAMNSFFGAVQSSPGTGRAAENSDSPLGLLGQLASQREALGDLRRVMNGLSLKFDQAKKRSVAGTNSWNIITSDGIPSALNRHVSVTRMAEKVDAAKAVRTRLESALSDVTNIKLDDSRDAVRKALAAITVFEELDPDDTYDVRRSKQLGKALQLELTWQGKKISLANLEEVRRLLQEILDEQEIISNAISVVLEFARQGVGPLLEANTFWNQVDSAPSPNGRVTVMWQELVLAGNGGTLSRLLGGKSLYLEQARRQGKFGDESGCVGVQLEYLLVGSEDHAPSETRIASARFLELQQKLRTRQSWSLKEVNILLERTLRPYAGELQKMPVEATPPWPSAEKRLTLSRGAYNMMVQAVRHSERLAYVMTWLNDYQRNLANWAQVQGDLRKKIRLTEQGQLQANLKKALLDLCPEYPEYPVLYYEAKTPPLTPRS